MASGYLLKRTRYATFSGKFIHLWCIKTGKWYEHCALKLILLRRSFPGCSSSFWYDNFVCVILSFMLFRSQQRNSKHGIFNIRIFVQISVCPVNLSRKRFARFPVLLRIDLYICETFHLKKQIGFWYWLLQAGTFTRTIDICHHKQHVNLLTRRSGEPFVLKSYYTR